MVKQVRVIRNTLIMGGFCGLILWFDRESITANLKAVGWGVSIGIAYGLVYWARLVRRISRKDRRFERNKIFVKFISPLEVFLLAMATSHYIFIGIAFIILAASIFDWLSGYWWSVLIGSFGISASVFLSFRILIYERKNGPVFYQYDTRAWTGPEALLYQTGEVVQSLTPHGKVFVYGELWNAVSLSGEPIEKGEKIEVISRKGLTLHVDRAPNELEEEGENR
ncbi:MAG TPA: NfeD family protein [Nitrospiria bacterium]|jgi:membrane protein implicated in regulation of membrane protease activity